MWWGHITVKLAIKEIIIDKGGAIDTMNKISIVI